MSAATFPPSSRYAAIETTVFVTPDGKAIAYLQRRFLPAPATLFVAAIHTVTQGDRLDNIAAQSFGDPELAWRICDANSALRPEDLTGPGTIGRILRITLPPGMVGAFGA
jgi:hypothetical protein